MDQDITVVIKGSVGTGKTTLAFLIGKVLAEAGLGVQVHDEDIPVQDFHTDGRTLAALKKRGTKVKVVTVQTRKSGYQSS